MGWNSVIRRLSLDWGVISHFSLAHFSSSSSSKSTSTSWCSFGSCSFHRNQDYNWLEEHYPSILPSKKVWTKVATVSQFIVNPTINSISGNSTDWLPWSARQCRMCVSTHPFHRFLSTLIACPSWNLLFQSPFPLLGLHQLENMYINAKNQCIGLNPMIQCHNISHPSNF